MSCRIAVAVAVAVMPPVLYMPYEDVAEADAIAEIDAVAWDPRTDVAATVASADTAPVRY